MTGGRVSLRPPAFFPLPCTTLFDAYNFQPVFVMLRSNAAVASPGLLLELLHDAEVFPMNELQQIM